MASFSDLLQNASNNQSHMASAMSLDDEGVVVASDTSISEVFERVSNPLYLWIDEYEDTDFSYVDEFKNVTVDKNQVNLTQEENSQVIPFELNRYYDGIDLSKMTFQIYYVNADGNEGISTPINVKRSENKIRFYWLLDGSATSLKGTLEFEIQAEGTVSYTNNGSTYSKSYKWKTKPNKEINILESLNGNGAIEPSAGWDTYLQQVSNLVTQANDAATVAIQAAQNANAAVDTVNAKIDSVSTEVADATYTKVLKEVSDELSQYCTDEELDTAISRIQNELDNLDGLAALRITHDETANVVNFYNGEQIIASIKPDPSAEWTTAYDIKVDEKIYEAIGDTKTDFEEYKEIVDADLKSIHDNIDALPEILASDYYTIKQTDELLDNKADSSTVVGLSTTVNQVQSETESNKSDISTIAQKIAEIEEEMTTFNTDPTVHYYSTYDASTGEFQLIEVSKDENDEEVETVVSTHIITGGSGGSSSSTTVTLERITPSTYVVLNGNNTIIEYNFSSVDSTGDDTGSGTAVWKVGNTVVATTTAVQGYNSFDVSNYVSIGSQKVTLTITDAVGAVVTKYWTVQIVDVRLETSFSDEYTYPIGNVLFSYTPYGAISKVVHFVLDGEEIGTVTTSSSGIPMSYTIPSQEHGSHLLETYITADINGTALETEHIYKDILWFNETSTTSVIGCSTQNITSLQYNNNNIVYTVYDPTTETPKVTLAVDGEVVSTLTLETPTNIWQYKSSDIGEHVLTITCGETVKTIYVTIEKLDIDISPVTAGLVFDFNPSGYSNSDENRLWTDGTTSMIVSDNFDWVNGGYQIDDNGDQYFCVKAGTTAIIDYQLFADDAKKNGKEFKLVFKTTNVAKSDAQFLSCMDNTTGSDHIGVEMNVHEAFIYGQSGKLELSYSEEDIIEFEFNISKNTEAIPMVMGYEDGVSTRPMVYDDSYNFTQNTPKIISLGSKDCDLHIYRFKVYNTSLTDSGILNNFIADARNAEEMVNRYDRNQIYDENQNLDPDVLAEKCPWLRVYKLSAPYFTNNKSDKVPYTTIQQLYKNGDPILDKWTCYDCSHSGQGTSSNNYGGAGRNLDFIMNKSQRDGVKPYFILGDGSRTDKITLTRTSVPTNYLNAKVNIASSNNMTNAMLANRYNEFQPYNRPFVRTANLSDAYSDEEIAAMTEDEQTSVLAELQAVVDAETAYIKDTMQFFNCVIFIQETNEDISTHREFSDTNWHKIA